MARETEKKVEVAGEARKRAPRAKNPCVGCELDCSECLVGGVRDLRRAACKVVGEKRAAFAKSLMDRAIEGDLNSAKLLLKIAGQKGKKDAPKRTREAKSAAKGLAAEPEWHDPAAEAGAETEAGRREPEGY